MEIFKLKCDGIEDNTSVASTSPVFSYLIRAEQQPCYQKSYRILVSVSQADLDNEKNLCWDSGWIDSPKTWGIVYSGCPLEEFGRYYVKVQCRISGQENLIEKATMFETALIHSRDIPARWIGYGPLLRREFNIKGDPVRAKIAITGLGYYELYINGERVGDETLAPSYTWYEKRIEYQCHDVTHLLKTGGNCIGVMLGSHWKQSPDWSQNECYQRGTYYNGPLKTKAYLQIEAADGSKEIVCTDEGWKCADGPIIYTSIYDGEYYDANLEEPGFSMTGYDDLSWRKAVILEDTDVKLVCSSIPPIRHIQRISCKRITRLKNGDFVADFGVNTAGRCILRVDEPKGSVIKIKHAETLNDDESVNQANLRWAKACDTYVSAGRPCPYEPRFTYHGFRYVQISGIKSLTESDISAWEIRSSVEDTGSFSCSDERLNTLHDIMRRTIANNLHSIPTDCCQRDERQGWMGDGQLTNQAAIANFDMQFFYRKWLEDIADCQDPHTGNIPYLTAPAWAGGEALAWTCAYFEILYSLYQYYDDIQAVKKHYLGLCRYFCYLNSREDGDGLLTLQGLCDWLAVEPTEEANIRDALYFRFAFVLSELAKAIGSNEDHCRYSEYAEKIRTAYNKKYYSAHLFTDKNSGYYGQCYYVGQSANAIPISFGIPDKAAEKRIHEKLIYELTKSMGGLQLTTGFIGTKALFEALMILDRNDIAYDLFHLDDYPSYGFMLRHGATTIWERWQYRTDNEMNSHCHPPLAAPDIWFYRVAAGIRGFHIREDGICEFLIRPATELPLEYAQASQKTLFGDISVFWEKWDNMILLRVDIPPNSMATVNFGGKEYRLENGMHSLQYSGRR